MAEDQPELAYDPIVRDVAGILAGGHAATRDLLLRAATVDGILTLVERHLECIPGSIVLPAMDHLGKSTRRDRKTFNGMTAMLHRLWERAKSAEEAQDGIPF